MKMPPETLTDEEILERYGGKRVSRPRATRDENQKAMQLLVEKSDLTIWLALMNDTSRVRAGKAIALYVVLKKELVNISLMAAALLKHRTKENLRPKERTMTTDYLVLPPDINAAEFVRAGLEHEIYRNRMLVKQLNVKWQ